MQNQKTSNILSDFFIFGVGHHVFSRRARGSGTLHCDWFILALLHPTPTIWFSLDHKRYIRDGVLSGVLSGRNWKRSDSSDSSYNSDF